MKHTFTFIFLFLAVHLSAQHFDDWHEKDYFLGIPDHACRLKAFTVDNDVSYSSWDITYNKLDLNLNPQKLYIDGDVYFEFKSKTNDLNTITIDLSASLTIESLTNGNQPITYKRRGDKVDLTLPNTLNKGDQFQFSVKYYGTPTSTGFGAFTQNFHGNNIPSLETLSEPYGAKEWWPCKQSLVDKIDSIDIIVVSPEQYETASNGILIENSVFNNQRTCHWKHRHRISTYLVFLVCTEYEKYSEYATLDDGTKVEILNYVFPTSLVEAQKRTPITADLIEKYSELFIDYPFKDEKYGHAEFSWGGGMEHQTMSSMGGFSTGLIAHELAHQWFGDYITCGSWQEIWLNEGFATYLAGLYFEHFEPQWWDVWKDDIIKNVTAVPTGSIFVQDTTNIGEIFSSRLSYKKAAYVLHMLRGQIGDEDFFAGIKNYLNDDRVANGFGTTDYLRENFELAADTTLTEYFSDWIMGEGHPIFDINCNYSSNSLSVSINQTPSTPDGPLFDMKVPISLYYKGEEQIIWVPNTKASETLEFSLDQIPDSVVINKDRWILGEFNNTVSSVPFIQNEELKVYFNSIRKTIYAEIPHETEGIISVFNMSGQLLKKQNWTPDNREVSTQEFTNGIYVVRFDSETKSLATRISFY